MKPFVFLFCVLAAVAAAAQDPSLVLADGGLEFPDGTVQSTAATQGLAPVEDTGQDSCWDTAGNVILCSDPLAAGQDGKLRIGVDWPAPRFIDNLNGTVTDNLTGLIWLRDADCLALSPNTWENALTAANTLASAICGLTDASAAGDWRLPNIKELLSLVDYDQSSPALPSEHPFVNVQSLFYWSSTSSVDSPIGAWGVFMADGSDVNGAFKTLGHRVWPVRGGQ